MVQAASDIERCLDSQIPGFGDACPAHVPIPEFMHAVAEGDLRRAARILRAANPLPGLCGRLCPPEQCELACRVAREMLPVRIGHLVRFVADWERGHPDKELPTRPWRTHRVAVIGSGAAGLVCAGTLARLGYPVTILEGLETPGGMLRYGAQESHFPESILKWEINLLKRLGVEINCNVMAGGKMKMQDLFDKSGFDAVFVSTGAGMARFLGIPGENLNGVYTTPEFLTRVNLQEAFEFSETDAPLKIGGQVAVVGADSAALDAICAALRLGAEEAHVIHCGSATEMIASREEYERAVDAGVEFHWLTRPTKVLCGEGDSVAGLECIRMEPGEPEASGQAEPTPIPGSEFTLPINNMILSLGSPPNPLEMTTASGPTTSRNGGVIVEEGKCQISPDLIYTGAEVGRGAASVIMAASAGKDGAAAIHKELCGEDWLEFQSEKEWDDFLDWCREFEHATHE